METRLDLRSVPHRFHSYYPCIKILTATKSTILSNQVCKENASRAASTFRNDPRFVQFQSSCRLLFRRFTTLKKGIYRYNILLIRDPFHSLLRSLGLDRISISTIWGTAMVHIIYKTSSSRFTDPISMKQCNAHMEPDTEAGAAQLARCR